jgi:hypothetical protein
MVNRRSPVDNYATYPQPKLSTSYDQIYKVFIQELSLATFCVIN